MPRTKGYTCVAHVTTLKNYEAMSKGAQAIYTVYDRYVNKVAVRGVYSYCDLNFNKPFRVCPGDFPGVYMHLVDDLDKFTRSSLCDNTVILIFPLELLQQHNWHFNINDRCGSIGYDTYFPETFEQSPHIDDIHKYYTEDKYIGNELIFHHSVPLHNASHISVLREGNVMTIANPIYNLRLDLHLTRNCVFYSDDLYSGTDINYYCQDGVVTTSNTFYINLMYNELPEMFKHLCDDVTSKNEMENAIMNCRSPDGTDLFTYLYVRNQSQSSPLLKEIAMLNEN